jgi:O-antigen ligase
MIALRIGGLRDPRTRWAVGILLVCLGIGIASGVKPVLGIELAFALSFAFATVANVTVGLVLFTVLSFVEVINNTGGTSGASFTKLAGLVLFGSWFASRVSQSGEERASSRVPTPTAFMVLCTALLAWSALSATWADSSGIAMSSTGRYALEIILIPIVLIAIQRRDQLQWFLAAFVIGAVLSTIDGFLNPVSAGLGDYGRLTGTLGDANEQAAVLVAAMPMAVGLASTLRHRPPLRALSWAAALICLVGAVDTLSRGGLVALGAVLVAAVVFGGRWRAQATALLLATMIGTVAYFAVFAPASAQQRVTMSDTNGRTDIWTVAWRIVQAHPLNGVGSGNFQNSAIHYLQAPGSISSANLIVDVPHVAHNIYLEVLADMGIPGLIAFLGIVVAAFGAAYRAAREFERQGDFELELVARSLLLALVAFMTADFFLSGEYSKQLWLTIAICPAALNLSRSQARSRLHAAA